jgi:hypothetical protein
MSSVVDRCVMVLMYLKGFVVSGKESVEVEYQKAEGCSIRPQQATMDTVVGVRNGGKGRYTMKNKGSNSRRRADRGSWRARGRKREARAGPWWVFGYRGRSIWLSSLRQFHYPLKAFSHKSRFGPRAPHFNFSPMAGIGAYRLSID